VLTAQTAVERKKKKVYGKSTEKKAAARVGLQKGRAKPDAVGGSWSCQVLEGEGRRSSSLENERPKKTPGASKNSHRTLAAARGNRVGATSGPGKKKVVAHKKRGFPKSQEGRKGGNEVKKQDPPALPRKKKAPRSLIEKKSFVTLCKGAVECQGTEISDRD